MAQEVERHPFGGEDAARRAFHRRDQVAGAKPGAIGPRDLQPDAGVDQPEGDGREVEPRDHAVLPRHQRGPSDGIGRHDRIRGQVAGAAQILEQGGAHGGLDHEGGQGRDGHFDILE